jgi:hypothetical protein
VGEEKFIIKASQCVPISRYDEKSRTCSIYGRDEICTKSQSQNLNGRDHLRDLRLERIILKWTLNKQGVD